MPGRKRVAGPKPYTPDWWALRVYNPEREKGLPKVVIGASEAAAACGVSRYGSPLELFRKKRGYVEDRKISEAAQIGLALEQAILDIAEHKMLEVFPSLRGQAKLRDPERLWIRRNTPLSWLAKYPFFSATPDGTLYYGLGVVDAKASFSPYVAKMWGEEGSDDLPDEYFMQAQQQMGVFGVKQAFFPVLLGAKGLKIYRVHAEPQIIDLIIDNEKELYERIVNDDPPEPNWEDPRILRVVREAYGDVCDEAVLLPDWACELYDRYESAKRTESEAKRAKEEALARILQEVKVGEIGVIRGRNVALVRKLVPPIKWTEQDVTDVANKVGTDKRKAYVRVSFRDIEKLPDHYKDVIRNAELHKEGESQ